MSAKSFNEELRTVLDGDLSPALRQRGGMILILLRTSGRLCHADNVKH